jgi:hypothetical protein
VPGSGLIRFAVCSLIVLGAAAGAASSVGVARAATAVTSAAPDPALAQKALAAVSAAGRYFADVLSVQGAYVYEYSEDLSLRRGEDEAGPTTGWVQPPGTPAVGAAFLRLYELTGEKNWLGAAHQVGRALVQTQLLSGGWFYAIDVSPDAAKSWCYRSTGIDSDRCKEIDGKTKNRTVLDDDTTQSAIRFLMWLDTALEGSDPAIRETADYALKRIIGTQYPNGSWPVYPDRAHEFDDEPADLVATVPADWPRTWVKPEGGPYYITNDNLVRDMIHVYLLAERQFGDREYGDAAVHGGEFLLMAQLPEPQPGWAQTYDGAMQPVWGRKFEPPSVASRETAGAASALLELFGRTGDKRFLDAAKRAVAWLESVRLPDGDWARFYELGTNQPLYVNADFELVYEPENLHPGYGFKLRADIPAVVDRVKRAVAGESIVDPVLWPSVASHFNTAEDLEAAVKAIAERDAATGKWVEDGWIRSQTFIDAVFTLGRYIEGKSW